MKNSFAPFAEWIWDQRKNCLAIHEWVLTDQNANDKTLPKPYLSIAEAKSLLLSLEERGLMYSWTASIGTVYAVHDFKIREWKLALKEIRAPRWQRFKRALQPWTRRSLELLFTAIIAALINHYVLPHILPTNSDGKNTRGQTNQSTERNVNEKMIALYLTMYLCGSRRRPDNLLCECQG